MSNAPVSMAFIQLSEQLAEFRDIMNPIKVKVPERLYRRLEWEMSEMDLRFSIRPPLRGKQSYPAFIMVNEFIHIEPSE